MALGIAGLVIGVFFIGLLSVAAVITGHIAQRRERSAKPFWLTGLITGYVGIGLGVITIGFYILFIAFAMSASYNG